VLFVRILLNVIAHKPRPTANPIPRTDTFGLDAVALRGRNCTSPT
jgi:hypothetical protein